MTLQTLVSRRKTELTRNHNSPPQKVKRTKESRNETIIMGQTSFIKLLGIEVEEVVTLPQLVLWR